MIPVEYVAMGSRDQCADFIARRFASYLKGDVLDVGCDKARLKNLVSGIRYYGIDIGGTPDRCVNLERERLPFPDRSYDCIVCSNVLEHLDNLHEVFDELVRVSRKHIVVSLPNNWANARKALERGYGSFSHYGLPAERPLDRHKWFFPLSDAISFTQANADKHKLKVTEMFVLEKPRFWLVQWIRRMRYPKQICYLNRYSHALWAVLSR